MRTDLLSSPIVGGLFTLLLLVASAPLWAQTDLIESVPAHNEQLMESPSEVELIFREEVQLTNLTLTARDGTAVPLDFSASRLPSDQHNQPLPNLDDGHYNMQWSALAEDGYIMNGQLSFLIDGDVDPAEVDTGAEPGVEPQVEPGMETQADTEAEMDAEADDDTEAGEFLGPNE